nr:MAG TPA: hypothetical protein [Caudoviricetes sp.]
MRYYTPLCICKGCRKYAIIRHSQGGKENSPG